MVKRLKYKELAALYGLHRNTVSKVLADVDLTGVKGVVKAIRILDEKYKKLEIVDEGELDKTETEENSSSGQEIQDGQDDSNRDRDTRCELDGHEADLGVGPVVHDAPDRECVSLLAHGTACVGS